MSSTTRNHPLPSPLVQQQQPQQPVQQRNRAKSSFSFRSAHSHKSSGSGGKIVYNETHQEKESKRLHSKADPSMALSEAEPSAVASGEKPSLAPIRAIQHRDGQGNPIADPDRSNPTRSRWERPLDTIRSFEAAIDESADAANSNRQSSCFGGTQVTADERPRHPQNGYYGRSQPPHKLESAYMDGKPNGGIRPDSYYNAGDNPGPSNGYHPNRARYPRTAMEPPPNNGQGVYPGPGAQHSYETVTTASGSGSSADPGGYSTDPSSENSSVDRIAHLPVKEPTENYGFNGFGNNPKYLPPGSGLNEQFGIHDYNGAQRQGNGYPNQAPPLPQKQSTVQGVPIKLGKTTVNGQQPYDAKQSATGEKRKSWLGRRFSKK